MCNRNFHTEKIYFGHTCNERLFGRKSVISNLQTVAHAEIIGITRYVIIYHLAVLLIRLWRVEKEEHRRESLGRQRQSIRGAFSSWGASTEVRDNSRRYSAVEKYKLNPAATAIEIWNHIVSIYHSRLLRRVLEPHTTFCATFLRSVCQT